MKGAIINSRRTVLPAVLVVGLTACSNPAAAGLAGSPAGAESPEILLGAGDIASCVSSGDGVTAGLLDTLAGSIFTAGDNLDPAGASAGYDACFEPQWGRHRERIRPAIGNQDYAAGAEAYFAYFGDRAGPAGLGYYSYDVGEWHVIVLNSNAAHVPTHRGSAQETWLREDLAAHRDTRCVMAVWHHPRFFQGPWNVNAAVKPFWDALYAAGADVVVNAHFQLYERYAPQTPEGLFDAPSGIRQFTVGTGGQGHDALVDPAPHVEVRDNTSYGVLRLTLWPDRYGWAFVPAAGGTFADSGSARCN